ncbi:DUF5131 family protein [Polyangium mundeleinium]|uniref:DUF5131 family protein n=1 Tax=Polyangium mundeleinium TaxID=2995306 RepID=A0ABT5EIZ9_9BACT|nr:DUF5131 family protein [Polyangium mundeleinium]MDC0740922.1 DUF5131 family protein [Polyangium mundeleinium]
MRGGSSSGSRRSSRSSRPVFRRVLASRSRWPVGKGSAIEWTHHTFNPWWGCTKISPGCKYCYAAASAERWGHEVWGKDATRRSFEEQHWREPLAWNRDAAHEGQRKRVFCASMADVFEDREDLVPHRERLWKLIAETPWLDWLLLTKRPENVGAMVPWGEKWPPNVWLGTTVENAELAAKRIPELIKHPAVVRFLSCEPLLDEIKLGPWLGEIDWVIVGGESGHGARPMEPAWARTLRDQCVRAGVAFFFKQWGTWGITEAGVLTHSFITVPDAVGEEQVLVRLGKKKSGRDLDGRTWDEVPSSGRRRARPRDAEEQDAGDAAMNIEGKSPTASGPAAMPEPEMPQDGVGAAAYHGSPRSLRVPSEPLPPGVSVRMVAIRDIVIPPNRQPDPDVVRHLVTSISDLGLLNPIILTPYGDLVAGRNRVAAYVELGYPQIEAHIETWGAVDRELAKIDENLVRRRFSVLERGQLLARRKELYEALHPEARQHARGGRAKAAAGGATEIISLAPAFAADAAAKLGTSERTVQEEIRIARNLAADAAELIRGTALADEKVKLMELTRLPRDQQAAVARLLAEGRTRSVKRAAGMLQRTATQSASVTQDTKSCGEGTLPTQDTTSDTAKAVVEQPDQPPAGAAALPTQGEDSTVRLDERPEPMMPIDPASVRRMPAYRPGGLAGADETDIGDQEVASIPRALADVRNKLRRSKPGRMNADLVSTLRELLTEIDRELRLHEEATDR